MAQNPKGGVVLDSEKLKILGDLIRRQEEQCSKNIPFKSEKERSDFLQCIRKNNEQVKNLLDEAQKLQKESESESAVTQDVVHEYLAYLELAAGYGFQILKSVHLRREFLGKVREFAESFIIKMHDLKYHSGLDENQIAERGYHLIEQLAVLKESTYNSIIKKADPSSQYFSKAVKLSGNSYDELIAKYQKKLAREKGPEYADHFDFLEAEQRIEVYDEVLKSSGRGSYLKNKAYYALEDVGKGLLLFTLGMSVWDIYSSDHKIQTTVTEAAEFTAGYYGGMAGEAIAAYLVTVVGVPTAAVTSAFVGLAVFATGLAVGIAVAYLAGYVVGKIFESGGKHTGGTVKLSDTKVELHIAPMPDGAQLARKLAYQGDRTKKSV